MKLSISLPDEDVALLDTYAAEHAIESRSATLHAAVQLLRERRLEDEYRAAILEWDGSEEAALWDSITGDGIPDDGERSDAAR